MSLRDNVATKGTKKESTMVKNRVLVKLNKLIRLVRTAPYKQTDPELWFSLLERRFFLYNITDDDTKFAVVCYSLDEEVLSKVRDIVITKPAERPYETLKLQVIKHRLEMEEMGDMNAINFLKHLRGLASTPSTDEIVRDVWLNCLPENYKSVLEKYKDYTLEQLSNVANCLFVQNTIQEIQNIAEFTLASLVPVKICWYHSKFGSGARQCKQPCSYNC